ncbi:hypothetical protein B0O80DRAFT_496670 [Mortierella sp. GBAus27b]|nr:hypothetical protein B0O80DRAFT_496670 [Mortierella sp. GBAus27b]
MVQATPVGVIIPIQVPVEIHGPNDLVPDVNGALPRLTVPGPSKRQDLSVNPGLDADIDLGVKCQSNLVLILMFISVILIASSTTLRLSS